MALDERARHERFLRLEQVLGSESAETLMEMMPPAGWADVATKRDLDALEERMSRRFEQRFGMVNSRFERLEQRFEQGSRLRRAGCWPPSGGSCRLNPMSSPAS